MSIPPVGVASRNAEADDDLEPAVGSEAVPFAGGEELLEDGTTAENGEPADDVFGDELVDGELEAGGPGAAGAEVGATVGGDEGGFIAPAPPAGKFGGGACATGRPDMLDATTHVTITSTTATAPPPRPISSQGG